MRAGNVYECPTCGERSAHPVSCLRCEVDVVDENGNPPPPLYERRILSRGYEVTTDQSRASGIADLVAVGSFAIKAVARRVSERGRQRRHRKAMDQVPRSPIARAEGPLVRVVGRAQVLAPAAAAQPEVAFSLVRVREHGGDGSRTVETRLCCSKFVIHDESGTALVDDDFIAILPAPGKAVPANGNATVVARDGQQVEVCGSAVRRMMPDLEQLGTQAGYRRGPEVLCFDGRHDRLLLLRPLE